jgi:phosphinothricin acetyltransferase
MSGIHLIMVRAFMDRIATMMRSPFREKKIFPESGSPYPGCLLPDHFFSPITENDRNAVIDIFNYYVETGFAAYPEHRVSYQYFDHIMMKARGYPTIAVRDPKGTLVGYGMLHSWNALSSFAHTAEVTLFFLPQYTGRGLGSQMLQLLETEGKRRGISCLLMSISSRNEGSLRFWQKHGCVECGRFRDVGKKHGILFDVVWMEKTI